MNALTEVLLDLRKRTPIKSRPTHDDLGLSPKTFYNKRKSGDFTVDEITKLADLLGYKIILVDKRVL